MQDLQDERMFPKGEGLVDLQMREPQSGREGYKFCRISQLNNPVNQIKSRHLVNKKAGAQPASKKSPWLKNDLQDDMIVQDFTGFPFYTI